MNYLHVARSLIDIAGKLGPLALAWLVYELNKRQTEFSAAVSRRSADVEDQKARLALFDRRIAVVEGVRSIYRDFSLGGEVTLPMVTRAFETAQTAELIYSDAEAQMAELCVKLLERWMALQRIIERLSMNDPHDQYGTRLDQQRQIEVQIPGDLRQLLEALIHATRIADVAPLLEVAHSQYLLENTRDSLALAMARPVN